MFLVNEVLTRRMPLISLCNFCSNSAPAASKTDKLKPEEYLDHLIHNKLLPPSLASKPHSELRSKILLILDRYEYELYRKSYDLMETMSCETNMFEDKKFQLEPYELNDILQAPDETQLAKIINYFISSKTTHFETRQNRKHKLSLSKVEKEIIDKHRLQVQSPTGLWSNDNELIYGLWHNALFIKFKRSCLSRLFDRRMVSATVADPANPRIILDLEYIADMDYFDIRRLGIQIRKMMAFNKYHTYLPFSIEFTQNRSQRSAQFDDLMSRIITNWNEPKEFQYVRHQSKSVDQLAPNPQSVFYICPAAKKALTTEEVLNPKNVFVLPAYATGNLRDPVFNKICSQVQSLNVNLRRMPTQEYVVWDRFHGVMGLDTIVSILNDVQYDVDFDWTTTFRRYLTGEKIKAEQELLDQEKIRREIYKSRARSIAKSFEGKAANAKVPKRIVTNVNK